MPTKYFKSQLRKFIEYFNQHNEALINEKYPISNLRLNAIILDIGAYHGEWSEWASQQFISKIFAFEPVPENFIHAKNKLKKKKNVILFPFAISNQDGTEKIYVTSNFDGCSFYDRSRSPQAKSIIKIIKVQTICLKTFMIENQLEIIDYIKINAEGAEIRILKSIDKDLSDRIFQIAFSAHTDKIYSRQDFQELCNHLSSLGYTVKEYSTPNFKNRFLCYKEK